MHIFDDVLYTDDHITLKLGSQSLNYGLSLFETIKVYKGSPQLLNQHVERLNGSLKALGLNHICDMDLVRERIVRLLESLNSDMGAIKLMVVEDVDMCHEIITYSNRVYESSLYEDGFSLCISNCTRDENSPLVQHKSSNYGINIIEHRKALREGFNEVIFLNTKGDVTEGALSNIFMIKDNVLYTPDIASGLLPGVMRAKVIEVAKIMNLKVHVGKITSKDLYDADEIFITNSLMGMMPVSRFGSNTKDINEYRVVKDLSDKLKKALGED